MKKVAIIMGSISDHAVMQDAEKIFQDFSVLYERKIVSAHRTPEFMVEYAHKAQERGFKVIIAAAGGAAHLPGMVASLTTLPVIGVPIHSSQSLQGVDSLLSIVQMPRGVPVATVGINNAQNAALLALRILALEDAELAKKLWEFKEKQKQKVLQDNERFSPEV